MGEGDAAFLPDQSPFQQPPGTGEMPSGDQSGPESAISGVSEPPVFQFGCLEVDRYPRSETWGRRLVTEQSASNTTAEGGALCINHLFDKGQWIQHKFRNLKGTFFCWFVGLLYDLLQHGYYELREGDFI